MTSSSSRTTTSDNSVRNGWPLRWVIASVVVVSMLLLSTALILLGQHGARGNALALSTHAANDAGKLINEQAWRMLEPVQASLRQLSFDPLVSATSLDERLQRLYVLSAELTANSLVTSLYVGYDNGDFILIRSLARDETRKRFEAPAAATFMVQTVALNDSGAREGAFRFYTQDLELIEVRPKPDYKFDPRTRPWYQSVGNSGSSELSAPYVFFTTQQVGLTLSQKSHEGGAVVGIDVVVDELAARLGNIRMTKSTQLALIDGQQRVLAYTDMSKVLQKQGEVIAFSTLEQLNVPSLSLLVGALGEEETVARYQVEDRDWLGVAVPFEVWNSSGMRLLVTSPNDELMSDLRGRQARLFLMIGLLALALMPLGWWAGVSIGHSLDGLSRRALRISRFDFSPDEGGKSRVREVNSLFGALDRMSSTIDAFLGISQTLATEPDVERMLESVLTQFVVATRCESGAVYLWNEAEQTMIRSATSGEVPASLVERFPYPTERGMRTGARDLSADQQQTELELRGRTGHLQGMLVLTHDNGSERTDAAFHAFTQRLSGMLAVSIETRQLIDAQKNLLDSVIRLMADAIDAKSPYTGGHCERVPQLATMLVDRLSADSEGAYADFSMSEEQRYEFYLGAWLHDCGKVTSPEHIVDKATKLEVIYNRIHELRMRFEVLWRDAEIEHLQRLAAGAVEAESVASRDAQHQQLRDDFAFVAQCNVGGEFMADASIERLRAVAEQTWQRHFDNRLGLSGEELRRLQLAEPEVAELPVSESLLADRREHIVPWGEHKPVVEKDDPNNRYGFDMDLPAYKQNMGEMYNLSIRRGTLTDEDRFMINDHIVQTYIMLKALPWPRHLAKVPEIAATHHEKMDGKGYPRRLPAERLSLADRVMALADIFEALTAADRPYKAPKMLSESLKIMAFMCKDQHLDSALFRYFLRSEIWRTFAERYMNPAQIDSVDIAALEALLPPPE